MTLLIARYWWAGLFALMVLALWVQETRVQSVKAALSQAKTAAEYAIESRENAAREHERELSDIQQVYTSRIEELDYEFQRQLGHLSLVADSERTAAGSLRDKLAAATRRSERAETSAAFCERERDRLEALGTLAGEGAELVTEARSLLQLRDAEIKRLQDQIASDRAAVEQASASQAFVR